MCLIFATMKMSNKFHKNAVIQEYIVELDTELLFVKVD